MRALYFGRYGMYYYDKNGTKVYTREIKIKLKY